MGVRFVTKIWLGLCLISGHFLFGQQLSFRHLGAEQGLRSLNVLNSVIDHYGFIWAATSDGLVRFDGKEVKYYDQQSHPQLPDDQIRYVFCDSRNQIWVCTQNGIASLNAERLIQRHIILPGETEPSIRACMEDAEGKIYALTYTKAFSLRPGDTSWVREHWLDSIFRNENLFSINRFDENKYLLIYPYKGVSMIDLALKKEVAFFPVIPVNCAARYDDHSILIGKRTSYELLHATIEEPIKQTRIPPPPFFNMKSQQEQITDIVRATDDNIYIVTGGAGMLVLDNELKNFSRYTHDPGNPATIIDNGIRNFTTDSTGILLLNGWEGIDYTNINNMSVTYLNYLRDEHGNLIDDRVISITEDKLNRLWLCTRNDLYIHDLTTGRTLPIHFPPSIKFDPDDIYLMSVERGSDDKIWAVLRNAGIIIFNSNSAIEKIITPSDYPPFENAIKNTRTLKRGLDGYMYLGTQKGLYRMDENTYSVDTFSNHPALRALKGERILDILPVESGIWIASSPHGAAYYYSFKEKKLKTFDPENGGLASYRAYCLAEGFDRTMYVGTYEGLSIIDPEDSIVNIVKGDGLLSTQIESMETADDGSIWMTNNYTLVKYDPFEKRIFNLGPGHGLPLLNYNYNASAKLASGKIVFGTSKGLIVVDPSVVSFKAQPPDLFIFYHNSDGGEKALIAGDQLNFNYTQRQLNFSFALNDLVINDQVLYKYRLTTDASSGWSNPTPDANVNFNLDPGNYELEVEAFDGENWITRSLPVRIVIRPPWWKTWWFLTALFTTILATLLWYFQNRIRKYQRELSIARQISELESKALRAQMNPHFVFNSLNAIQECIVTGKVEEAYTYLSKFSRLLRLVLEHSDTGEVTLHDELEVLELYISLEKLRFKNEMHYQFELDKTLDTEEILIPPMLIQPHLENAIWHGLRNKEGEKNLLLTIQETTPDYLEVIIQDDGIGRATASAFKKDRLGGKSHQSKGKKLSENRMDVLRKTYPLASMTITDLYTEDNSPAGTQVKLIIPVLKKVL